MQCAIKIAKHADASPQLAHKTASVEKDNPVRQMELVSRQVASLTATAMKDSNAAADAMCVSRHANQMQIVQAE
jgi:hypothetical protein